MATDVNDDWLVDVTFNACPNNLRNVRRLVEARAREVGCEEPLVRKLVLVVDEACANVIRHGYNGDRSGCMRLRLARREDRLDFFLRDQCSPVDPSCLKPRELPDDPGACAPGGLGLTFIDQVMDAWEFRAPEDGAEGNVLYMSRKIE